MEQMSEPMAPTAGPMEQQAGGIDAIIERVESYIQQPEMVTPQTMNELKMELIDLKTFLDGEETQEPTQAPQSGLSEMMSKYGGGQ